MKKINLWLGSLAIGTSLYAQTTTFNYTGGVQSYTVPAGVTSLIVDVSGAQGGGSAGLGANVTGVVAVTPGQVLNIYVGGSGLTGSGAPGGYNGGGNAGSAYGNEGSGGGASDIRIAPYGLGNRIVVAGGGGGGGGWAGGAGGAGGCSVGNNGNNGQGFGGGGGTQSAGGAGGAGNGCGNGFAGSLGQGGAGGACSYGGGGGGGGYYGGGGGGADNNSCCADGAGGGGGSSLAPVGTTCTAGTRSGAGLVTITIPPGAALNFDGTDDLVNMGTVMNTTLDNATALTVEAWVYPTDADAFGCIVGNYTTLAAGMQFLLRRDGNTFTYWTDRGAGYTSVSTPAIVAFNTWQHVAGVWDGAAGTMKIYVNGVLQGTSTGLTGTTLASSTNPVMLGWNTINEQMTGNLDEVRIWTRALCSSEINNNRNCEIPTTGSGLLANYHFNQGYAAQNNSTVTSLTDASGNNYNGALQNFTLNGTTSNWITPGGVVSGTNCAAFTPPAVTVSAVSQTNISCNGGNNGAASVTASGGSGFTYNWTPGNPVGDGTASVTGLTAGTWTCTVTNDCGGIGVQTFNITAPTALVVTAASQTNVSCNGGTNGAASINTPTGGAGGYTYNWTPGNPTGDGTVSVTGLNAGTWTCTVTDANSCTATQTFNITAPTALVVTAASQTNVSCNGGTNGAASINTPTGGAGGYTYNWTPGNPTGDGTVSVTGLNAGTWTCTVTDANSCTATQTFNITAPTALVVTAASQTNVSCNGGINGAASINTPTGGAGGYIYNWTPGNPTGDGTVSVTGLTAGTWTCTVTDANSCTATATFNITAPTAITASISSTPTACTSNTGTATVSSVIGGAGGFTYSWAPTGGTSATATGLGAGTYTCTITDANACTITRTVTVIGVAAPTLTALSQTNVACFGGATGAACVNAATGGTAPYTYDWTPGNPTGDGTTCVSGLTAGTWTCTVSDANGCNAVVTFSITSPSAIALTATATPTVICAGQSAVIAASATGGSGSFSYVWTPGSLNGPSHTVTPTTTTTYTVVSTDANLCTASTVLTVSVNPLPSVSLSGTNHFCPGGSTLLTGTSGGTSQWYLNGVAIVGATNNTYLATLAGVYNMRKTNTNGCGDSAAVGITVTVDTPPAIASVTSTAVLCFGDSNGSATVSATGTPSLSYSWAPSGGTSTTASGLTAGNYTVTVTDGNTCTSTATVTVTSPAVLSSLPSQVNATCFGGNDASASVSVIGGTAMYTYLWSPVLPPSPSANSLTAGSYSCLVTDMNGCTSTATFNITEPALITTSQSVTICNGDSLVIGSSVYSTAGTFIDTLTSNLGCDSIVTTALAVNPIPAVVSVTSAAICDSGSVTLGAAASGGANLIWYSDSVLTTNVSTGNTYTTPLLFTTTTYYVQADSAGCYSAAVPVTVTVNTGAVTINQSLTLCYGDSVTIGSNTYYASGVYADTINFGGCDSIFNSTITVLNQIGTSQTLTVCSGQSVTVGANTYTTSGIYMDTLSAISGCDSVVTTTLTVLPANIVNQNFTLCAGDSVNVGNSVYYSTGTYSDTIPDLNGCDSIINTVVNVNTVDITVAVTGFGGTLMSNASGPNTSWLWLNCQDNTTIISATMQSYTPSANGQFAVIVTQNGCTDTSNCLNVTNVGLGENNVSNFSMYPNPANDNITVQTQIGATIVIFDAIGNQVASSKATNSKTEISVADLANGIYFVKVISDNEEATQKLIISK